MPLNDLNILNLSPFLGSLLDGSLAKTEEEANSVPFQIGDNSFNQFFVLVKAWWMKCVQSIHDL
jgi:hypothetical protein